MREKHTVPQVPCPEPTFQSATSREWPMPDMDKDDTGLSTGLSMRRTMNYPQNRQSLATEYALQEQSFPDGDDDVNMMVIR